MTFGPAVVTPLLDPLEIVRIPLMVVDDEIPFGKGSIKGEGLLT